jgi:hypothetical protein
LGIRAKVSHCFVEESAAVEDLAYLDTAADKLGARGLEYRKQ